MCMSQELLASTALKGIRPHDASMLYESIGIWAKVVQGLPPGQLHFILNATVDTLPHKFNSSPWKRNHKPPVHYVESNRH